MFLLGESFGNVITRSKVQTALGTYGLLTFKQVIVSIYTFPLAQSRHVLAPKIWLSKTLFKAKQLNRLEKHLII